ncbi:MAG: TetR/AcrR family transcriptional regulator [Deltaproteobacteria bacterium]|nr:TetR/AcrR family transcriptional regulator [Deltaproteobacteria bacterium]
MAISAKRQEILHAALELIAEHGFHGAPIASIAERAGVGAGSIYRYFKNKDILITELFMELHNKICAEVLEGYEIDKPLRQRFLHLSTSLLRYLIANPMVFRYLEQFHNSPYGTAYRRDRILGKGEGDLYRMIFEEGAAQQVTKNLPLVVLFALTFGPLLAVARDHILGFIELDEPLITQFTQACWDGIKM